MPEYEDSVYLQAAEAMAARGTYAPGYARSPYSCFAIADVRQVSWTQYRDMPEVQVYEDLVLGGKGADAISEFTIHTYGSNFADQANRRDMRVNLLLFAHFLSTEQDAG